MIVSPYDYIHPEDKAALENLKAIPLFSTALKTFMKIINEQLFHGINMAQKIRLSPTQLPKLYKLLPPICEKLGIVEPEFYLEMSPIPNSYTYGDTKTFITITSGLVEYLDEDELKATIAHECGHIACNHVFYYTMAQMLFKYGTEMFGLLSSISLPLQLALLAWSRKSELSADRAAAVVMGGSDSVVELMIRFSGGSKEITADINIEEYIKQTEEYNEMIMNSDKDKALQLLVHIYQDHPFNAIRTKEIINWCNTEQFKRIINNENSFNRCPKCGSEIKESWKFCLKCGCNL